MDAINDREWMFDPYTGCLLKFDPHRGLYNNATKFSRSLDDSSEAKVVSKLDIEAFTRKYDLQMLVNPNKLKEEADGNEKATVDEQCPRCNKRGLLYFTLQLRSADEGQTVFYECPDCKYKYSQNN